MERLPLEIREQIILWLPIDRHLLSVAIVSKNLFLHPIVCDIKGVIVQRHFDTFIAKFPRPQEENYLLGEQDPVLQALDTIKDDWKFLPSLYRTIIVKTILLVPFPNVVIPCGKDEQCPLTHTEADRVQAMILSNHNPNTIFDTEQGEELMYRTFDWASKHNHPTLCTQITNLAQTQDNLFYLTRTSIDHSNIQSLTYIHSKSLTLPTQNSNSNPFNDPFHITQLITRAVETDNKQTLLHVLTKSLGHLTHIDALDASLFTAVSRNCLGTVQVILGDPRFSSEVYLNMSFLEACRCGYMEIVEDLAGRVEGILSPENVMRLVTGFFGDNAGVVGVLLRGSRGLVEGSGEWVVMVRSVCAGGYLETLKVLMEDERVLGRREELIVECLMELSRSAIRHDILAYLQSLKAEEKSEHRVEQVETSLKVVRTFSTNQFPISLLFTSLIAIFVLI